MQKEVEQTIKEAAQIADVVGHFLTLKKAGSRLTALCPFHDERTPSFYVTPSKGMYKCFGCGKGGDAVSFVMEYSKCTYPEALQTIGSIYNITTDGGRMTGPHRPAQRPKPAPPLPPPAPPSFIGKDVFRESLNGYGKNNFAVYLAEHFGADAANAMLGRYNVGTFGKWKGDTVFWYMDTSRRIRSGKVMLYNAETGKRCRDTLPTWAHTENKISGFNLVRCFFGENLLPKHPAAPVCIVESEKTAVIASLYQPDSIWLATGGQSFPADWQPLKDRNITLFPDADAPDTDGKSPFTRWTEKAQQMNKAGYNVRTSDLLERRATPAQRFAKLDLADYLLPFNPSEFNTLSAPQRPQPTNAPEDAQDATPPETGLLEAFGFRDRCREPLTDAAVPGGPTPAPEWVAWEEVNAFFANVFLPPGPIQLAPAQTITNPAAFVAAHLATCEANHGRRLGLPYLERLQQLKAILSQPQANDARAWLRLMGKL